MVVCVEMGGGRFACLQQCAGVVCGVGGGGWGWGSGESDVIVVVL